MVTLSRCFSFPIDESSLFETEGFGAFPSVLPLHHRAWLISAQLISGVRSPQLRSPVLISAPAQAFADALFGTAAAKLRFGGHSDVGNRGHIGDGNQLHYRNAKIYNFELTFKDINGLVEQNVQLRSLVRGIVCGSWTTGEAKKVDDVLQTKLEQEIQLVMDKGTLYAIGLRPDGLMKSL
ncbi:hypothetical protein RIF29_30054 [Crotalaria pallida]|uniref:Uncharacterized protein n=1 Tax=Crotalaria pallida TaxID=3830 RepID=A0AAN9HXZ9_CROPI